MILQNYSKFKIGFNTAKRNGKIIYCASNTPQFLIDKLKPKAVNKLSITSKQLGIEIGKIFPVLFISSDA